ncbi:MAG TPA: 50S ribosomal protein L11 methyltransferase [Candidatus Paceibacterota bacterium]|nr:50S ribosomal protein L11 methyltransferase [Candidatus Paceibacterota bacterium]
MKSMSDFWSMNEGTFACLHDKKRTLAFRKAIRNTIKKDDIVVELGAGSGILSMFAADAGAKRVYAVELDQGNIISLKQTIKENGYEKIIEIINADATTINFPEKPDVVICEMIATALIEELQVPAMCNARRFFKKTTKVLIEKYDIYAELVNAKSNFYNKKFNITRFELPEMRDMKSHILSNTVLIDTIDMMSVKINKKIDTILSFTPNKSATANALRLHGKTFFSSGDIFESSTSYDFPIIIPIKEIAVKENNEISFKLSYTLCGGPKSIKITRLS